MIRENPHVGSITWGDIATAERELIQPDFAIYLGDGHTFGLDCFEPGLVSSEFSYELSVTVTPDTVSVSDFRITRNDLPGPTKACLEELFAGNVTLDLAASLKRSEISYLPINTTLQRESDFVERVTRNLAKYSRDEILQRAQDGLFDIPQDALLRGAAQ